jgi:hypothetical protein
MNFLLTKNSWMYSGATEAPALISGDGCAGPFDREWVLPGGNSKAHEIVLRALANEPLESDPKIDAEPAECRDQYMLQFLRITESDIERARMIVKIVDGIKAKPTKPAAPTQAKHKPSAHAKAIETRAGHTAVVYDKTLGSL